MMLFKWALLLFFDVAHSSVASTMVLITLEIGRILVARESFGRVSFSFLFGYPHGHILQGMPFGLEIQVHLPAFDIALSL